MADYVEIKLVRDLPSHRLKAGDRIRLIPGSHMEEIRVTPPDYQWVNWLLERGVAEGEPVPIEDVQGMIAKWKRRSPPHLRPPPSARPILRII